jgi:hypothetical protein
MDTMIDYKKIIYEVVEYVYSLCPSSNDIDVQKIIDDTNGHYLLYFVGWQGTDWVYGSFLHIDIKQNGRIWLQHDGTDLKIAEEFIVRGIPKNNIVVDLQPPYIRPMMAGFASA